MNQSILLLALLIAAGSAFAGDTSAPGGSAATALPDDPRWPASSLPWTRPFGLDGPEMAYVHGDPRTGPYKAFLRMPTGAVSGWHTHDATYMGGVQGTYQHLIQGEKAAAKLGPGSVWREKGAQNHDDRCIKGPCVVYLVSEGPQSYHPKTADGGDPPPPTPSEPPPPGQKQKK